VNQRFPSGPEAIAGIPTSGNSLPGTGNSATCPSDEIRPMRLLGARGVIEPGEPHVSVRTRGKSSRPQTPGKAEKSRCLRRARSARSDQQRRQNGGHPTQSLDSPRRHLSINFSHSAKAKHPRAQSFA
jgi:hypothetical protein